MTQLIKNLIFIGTLLHPKKNSPTKFNFKVTELAEDLDTPSQTLHKWLEKGVISKTQLRRISTRINNFIDLIEITPEKLLNYDLEAEYNAKGNRVSDIRATYNTKQLNNSDTEIIKYLKKYPYMKSTILELLKKHDKK